MIRDVVVTVPAADEQDEIAGCLGAVQAAIERLHAETDLAAHIVVTLDDCRDRTPQVVAQFAQVHAVVASARRVGAARRQAAEAGLARFGPPERVWLTSTDADSRVSLDWLTSMIAEARRGAELVLGTVRPGPGLPVATEQAWRAAHQLSDGHPHVHGANLGISGAAYVRIGGWSDLVAHEDVELVQRAVAAAVPVARSGGAPVLTSTRLEGRTPDGFAAYLRALQDGMPA
ncbi:MAG TPA: glycosyltransferase [Jatrophihabitans sp.]